jgi:hypothetical protein
MKISHNTVVILQNFSQINQSLMLTPGNVISTRNGNGTVRAKATVEETFPEEVPIYDLSKFIALVSAMKTPDISFQNKKAVIKSDTGGAADFYYAEKSLIKAPSADFPDIDVVFESMLPQQELATLTKTASIVSATMLSVTSTDDGVFLKASDPKTPGSNSYAYKLAEPVRSSFSVHFPIENLKMIPTTYTIAVGFLTAKTGARVKVLRFTSDDETMVYLVAAEINSVMGDPNV